MRGGPQTSAASAPLPSVVPTHPDAIQEGPAFRVSSGDAVGAQLTTFSAFVAPAVGSTTTITVASATPLVTTPQRAQNVFLAGAGYYLVTAISGNVLTAKNLGVAGNASSGTPIPAGSLSFGLAPWLTVASGNLSALTDRGGANTVTPTGVGLDVTSAPVNARGARRALFDLQPKVNGSKLDGSSLFGGGSMSQRAFTVVWSGIFAQAPSSGTGSLDALISIGPVGSGTAVVVFTSTAGNIGVLETGVGASVTPWGTATIHDGTPGTTPPSYQVIVLTYGPDPSTGTWMYHLYVDGILVLSASLTITLGSDAFSVADNAGGFIGAGPHTLLADAIWYAQALTRDEVRGLSLWCLQDLGAPATAIAVVGIGDSIMVGDNADGAAPAPQPDGYLNALATHYLAAYPSAGAMVTYDAGVAGTTGPEWATDRGVWGGHALDRVGAFCQLAVRARLRILVIQVGINDLGTWGSGYTDPTAQDICMQAYASLIQAGLKYGADLVVLSTIFPLASFAPSNTPNPALQADAAGLRARVLAASWGSRVVVWDMNNTGLTTPAPPGAPAATLGGLAAIVGSDANFESPGGIHPLAAGHAAASWYLVSVIGPR